MWKALMLTLTLLLLSRSSTCVKTRGKPPPEGATIVREVVKFKPIKLPTAFTHYDLDADEKIQLTELAKATGTALEDAGEAFEVADTNKDGVIDEQEFNKAPWRLDGKSGKRGRRKKGRSSRGKKQKKEDH